MELHILFSKWRLNHNLFADLLNMPKGTFNNKLNPKHSAYFNNVELLKLKIYLKNMAKDSTLFANAYLEEEEDFIGLIAEKLNYNNKAISDN